MTSGIRVGTPAVTTRNMKEEQMGQIGEFMGRVLNSIDSPEVQKEVEKEVKALTSQFPLYTQRLELAQKLD